MSSPAADVTTELARAESLCHAGRFGEAEGVCRGVLERHPNDPSAWHVLGVVALAGGRADVAAECCARAIGAYAQWPSPHYTLASALVRLGRAAEAEASYRRNIALGGGSPGELAMAYGDLGVLLQSQGRLEEAEGCYRRVLEIQPDAAKAYNNLGVVLNARGRREEATRCYAAALRERPEFPEAWVNLGNVCRVMGRLEEALEAYGRAARLAPQWASPYYNAGVICRDMGLLPDAIASYRRALELDPADASAWAALLYARLFDPAATPRLILDEHREWAARFAPPAPMLGYVVGDRSPDRPLRVGYVSPHFRSHAVTFFTEPILASHDKSAVHVTCYSEGAEAPDATTARLRSYADAWRDVTAVSDERLAAQVRDDRIDVLVDLAGHLGGSRVRAFRLRPAPVQVTYMGYQATTGVATIDYRLTDAAADPPGTTDAYYVEKLYRLPGPFFCYRPADDAPPVAPLPALAAGGVTFGFLNHLAKLNDGVIETFARVLLAAPGSRLMILTHGAARFNEALRARFVRFGVDGQRVQFLQRGPRENYLGHYRSVDVALDPFPFAGHTTTCDGLWQGVPTVTLAGETYAGRMGVSVLTYAGLSELIAETPQRYVEVAVGLAGDVERLRALRVTMRDRLRASPITDAVGFTRQLEGAYREMWRTFCAS